MIRALILAIVLLHPNWAGAGIDRVLLIGVTDYAPKVTEIAQPLNGPGNDVALMLDVFQSAGVAEEAFSVLTDRPDVLPESWAARAIPPRRIEILSALDRLVLDVMPGQSIAIFLAGHGAQVPAPDALEEPDGLDEVFLPADFDMGRDGRFYNQISDTEIGSRIDALVAGGAHVWLIADTCHSGSLRRSDGSDAVPRFLDLAPEGTGLSDPAPIVDVTVGGSDAGSFVGFYGAEAGSLAFETRARETGTTHGLLTLALARALRRGEARTFRALAGQVSAELWQAGRGRASPAFDGALAREQMLGTDKIGGDDFAIGIGARLEIAAGLLDGVKPGAEVAVAASDGEVLFGAAIVEAGLTRAFADLPEGDAAILDDRIRKEGLDPATMRLRWLTDRAPSLRATVTRRTLDFGLRVKLPDDASEPLRVGVERMAPLIEIVKRDPDLSLVRDQGRLHFRPASPGAARALSVTDDAEGHDLVPGFLRRAAKNRALLSVAEALRETDVSRALEASLEITAGRETVGGACAVTEQVRRHPTDAPLPVRVGHCERVSLSVTNSGPVAVDISPLYLASDNQVYFLTTYAGSEKGGWRISPQSTETLSYTEATRLADGAPLSTGPMHLVLLAVAAKGDGDPVDFRYLQDIAPPTRLRSGDVTPLAQLLDAAGFGLALTRSISQHDLGAGGALIVPIETIADERLAEKND